MLFYNDSLLYSMKRLYSFDKKIDLSSNFDILITTSCFSNGINLNHLDQNMLS
jgi:hypothetical protein